MDYLVHIRRRHQFEKWKWLLVVGLVAITHLFCQSLMLPYGNALLSLMPDGNFTIHEKVRLTSGQLSANKSVIVDDPLSGNSSLFIKESKPTLRIKRVGKIDVNVDIGDDKIVIIEETEKANHVISDSKGIDNGVDFVEDANLDNDMPFELGNENEVGPVENDNQAHEFVLRNTGEIVNGLSLEQVVKPSNQILSDKMPGSSLTVTAGNALSSPITATLNSANLMVNLTSPENLASNASASTISALNVFTKGEEIKALQLERNNVLMQSDYIALKNDSALVSKPVKKKMRCEMPPKTITPIHEMERLLVHHRARSRAMRPRWSSGHDQEILSAKLQIENAPILRNDRDLYAPLFRNVSTFKRSYEIMEQILKIYVYKEGEKPIFHQPILKGLYASEGWFMKLMEGNKRFVVKDPRRAHLFYMPFSSRNLEHSLYVRNSHNRTNLRQYLQKVSMPSVSGQVVCVTGAGGFIASWIVKLLLEKGYTVRGTVRNPDDAKNNHLRELEGAEERLTLCKADLLDYQSLREAINGCDGVFHTASPVTDDPEQMVEPAVIGTKNVINAAAEATVRRVVFTSSIGAVYMDPNRDPETVVDESCWSDLEFCKNTKNWYCYGKTVAEQAAMDEAKEKGVDIVVINPVLVLGPLLQPTLNASVLHILKYLTGSAKTYANSVQAYVHVKDVALAHILLYETPSASGRHLCAESVLHRGEVVEILVKFFPEYPIPKKCSDETKPRAKPYKFTNQKLKDLGFEFTPVKQCLYDTVKSLQEKGHLPVPTQNDEPIKIL